MVNDKGGVDGRKIEFKTVDDGYEPPKAVQASRKLVEQDKVFALFNTLGTPSNLAIWDYTNQEKVPAAVRGHRRVRVRRRHQGATRTPPAGSPTT